MRSTSLVPLAVVVLTYNEEANLPACLESLEALQCEVYVVDSGSTDGTLEIAKRLGANVLSHPFETYSVQRNWAQQQLSDQFEWVLHLDADERLTIELVIEINQLRRNPPEGIDGFMLRKRTIFMGRWIRHGGHYPSYHLRLFRKERGRCEDRLYDQHFIVNGEVGRLAHDYIDVITSDLKTWTQRHARWAELEATELITRAKKNSGRVQPNLLGSPIERRRWLKDSVYGRSPMFARAFLYWAFRYFVRLGFLDGKEGLIFHFLQGCWYRFLVDAKIYELKGSKRLKARKET